MKESAPATLRVPVPGWERLAAGAVAVGWAVFGFVFGYGVAWWWGGLRRSVAVISSVWEAIAQGAEWKWYVQPDAMEFAQMIWYATELYGLVALSGLIGVGGWVAAGGGSRGFRGIFWLVVVSHGLALLAEVGAAGRVHYLGRQSLTGQLAESLTWDGGWLDYILHPQRHMGPVPIIAGACEIVLGGLMLWFIQSRKAGGTAERRAA